MSLGGSRFTEKAGSGQARASAAKLARSIVGLGCSPLGTPNTLISIGDPSQIPSMLDSGGLAEWVALTAREGQTRYAMPINPSQAGGISATVGHTGTGTATITPTVAPHKPITVLCTTGGALGTAKFKFSLDGGTTYGPEQTSNSSAPWVYSVPGTYCALSFAAATYVVNKTLTVGVDGTVTPGSSWVGTVTQASSPIDTYEVLVQVIKAGALGVATLAISLDNGRSTEPNVLIPSAGVLVVAGTGLVLTCSGTFVAGDTYSFLAHPPTASSTDVTNALTALKAIQHVTFTQVHLIDLPASVAAAESQRASLQSALDDAFNNYELDWDGMCECPSSLAGLGYGDIIMSGSNAARDTADTDTAIIAARGADSNRVAIHAGTYPITSQISQRKILRPLGWAVAARFVDTDPKEDISALQPFGALPIYIPAGSTSIGRDEYATPGLDDIQYNTARTYRNRNGVYLSITAGGSGWKNCTTNASWQDKGFMRVVNSAVASLRPVAQDLLGQRPATNADGTIAEKPAAAYDTQLNGAFQRATGVQIGGDFTEPQVSTATAKVLRTSQLGQSPKRLDIAYTLQSLGFVSDVSNVLTFSGVLTVSG